MPGLTAYLVAGNLMKRGKVEYDDGRMIRKDLRRFGNRVEWQDFVQKIEEAENAVEAAKAFLFLANPDDFKKGISLAGKNIFASDPDGTKRISRYDRLRLREQIEEAREDSEEEAQKRGLFCGRLLLEQMEMAALQTIPNDGTCAVFTRYLLISGVMRYVPKEAHAKANEILGYYEVQLKEMKKSLSILPSLTEKGEVFVGMATQRQPYLGRVLHQWHAHGDLEWLTEQNVVGAFESLVSSNSVKDVPDFCSWIGELAARIHGADYCDPYTYYATPGAWDDRLPPLFWGDLYTRFLLGEADRTKPVFDEIVKKMVKMVGGSVTYKPAPNKNYSRVSKKQVEYASFGLMAQHVAMDHMRGCFSRLLRADMDSDVTEMKRYHVNDGAILVLASLGTGTRIPEECFNDAEIAVNLAKSPPQDEAKRTDEAAPVPAETPPIVVLFLVDRNHQAHYNDGKARLEECGASIVCQMSGPLDDPRNFRKVLSKALEETYAKRGSEAPVPESSSVEKLQVAFEMQKTRTEVKEDMLTCGGLLDLVRGSVTCTTEKEVKAVYERALAWTLPDTGAEVVRVKNGFNKPAVGGYCDLKLFVQVAHDSGHASEQVHHICELQVHLEEFLDKKKFTHMPYVIDRGDFDDS